MARIYIEPENAKRVLRSEDDLSTTLRSLAQDVESVRSAMDYQIAGKAAISSRLRETVEQVAEEASSVSTVRSCLEQVITRYEQAENQNLGRAQTNTSGNRSSGSTYENGEQGVHNLLAWLTQIGALVNPLPTFPHGVVTGVLDLFLNKMQWEGNSFQADTKEKGSDGEPLDSKIKLDMVKAFKDRGGLFQKIDDFEDAHKTWESDPFRYYKDLKTGELIAVTEKNESEFKKHNKGALPVDIKLLGVGSEGSISVYDLDGSYTGKYGGAEANVALAKLEGSYGAYLGMLGLGAQAGASFTAFSAEEKAYLGTEDLHVYEKIQVEAGKLEAKIGGSAGFVDKDGKFNPSLYAGGSAEAIAGEASASVGMKALGADVALKGSVNYGIGAHANLGYHDGKLSVDVGATLGVGVGVKVDIDVSGTIQAIHGKAKEVWSGVKGLFGW